MNIIRWFVLLLHKDMQNYQMDEKKEQLIYQKIKKNMKKEEEI